MEADAKKDLIYLILFLIGLGLVWYYTGGPNRGTSKSPFVIPPYPIEEAKFGVFGGGAAGGGSDGEGASSSGTAAEKEQLLSDIISFGSVYKAKETDPSKEYIEIKLSSKSKNKILFSGLRLKGDYGLDLPIGEGVYLYWPGITNSKEPIFIEPGGTAIITSGQSPVGYSFRVNKCTGYFEQFQDFYPSLSKDCPYSKDENLPAAPNNLDDKCLDYIDNLSRCEAVESMPEYLSSQCQEYLSTKINYKACVDAHRNDSDFYKNEWRIFLDRNEEMWKEKRETIELLDQSGNLIKLSSY